ncbi:PilZ domain-containing protein [Marispirochaeta sp.]|uniref:PilZ domain-containing protein n=1 Tax=Marispirochaeta sp. TaxID=2038653 RepID=UPI0029C91779|nr:PilZ domain-containing protein [Marispirochaeta sp.]
MEEKRGMTRYDLAVPAVVKVADGRSGLRDFKVYTRDVSSQGTFLKMEKPLELGRRVELEIYLSINKLQEFFKLDDQVCIKVRGEVIRIERDGVGISFDKRYTILPSVGGSVIPSADDLKEDA